MPHTDFTQAAILGGKPLCEHWPKPELEIGDPERSAILKVLESKKWWRGVSLEEMNDSECGRFEQSFCAWQGVAHGLCVTNGTAAVECALKACGLLAGDEVIVPAISFIVTASAVSMVGGRVRFVDVDPETYQIDPDALAAAITPQTKGICLVHYGGYPADMDRVMAIARAHNLFVMEDCAHAHGTQWRGQGVGGLGDAGTFSFQMFKTLTAGEGGFIASRHQHIRDHAYSLHHLGRRESEGSYAFEMLAWNLRMTEWQGAILNCQIERVKQQQHIKMENARWLSKQIEALGIFKPLRDDERITRRGYYSYIMRYQCDQCILTRDEFIAALAAEGIQLGRGYFSPLHHNQVFKDMRNKEGQLMYADTKCPESERICATEQCTLSHDYLRSRESLQLLIDACEKVFKHAVAIKQALRDAA